MKDLKEMKLQKRLTVHRAQTPRQSKEELMLLQTCNHVRAHTHIIKRLICLLNLKEICIPETKFGERSLAPSSSSKVDSAE